MTRQEADEIAKGTFTPDQMRNLWVMVAWAEAYRGIQRQDWIMRDILRRAGVRLFHE